MKRFVVDLENYQRNIQNVIDKLHSIEQTARQQFFKFKENDIQREIKFLENFDKNLISSTTLFVEKQTLENGVCESESIMDTESQDMSRLMPKKPTDIYGNTYRHPPFKYSYAEITYQDVSNIQVRLLGNSYFVPVRYFIQNLEMKECSETTFNILSDIDAFLGVDDPLVITKKAVKINKKSDDKYDYPSAKQEQLEVDSSWRQRIEKYFYPSPRIVKIDKDNYLQEFEEIVQEKEKTQYSKTISSDEVKEKETGKPKKRREREDSFNSLTIKSRKEEPKQIDKIEDLVVCENDVPMDFLDKDFLDQEVRKIIHFLKEQSVWTMIKDAKDHYIPTDQKLTDIIFRNFDIESFYSKLNLLKDSNMEPLFDTLYQIIEKSIEDKIELKEIKEISKQIKKVSENIDDDKQLKSFLLDRIGEYEDIIKAKVEEISLIEETIKNIEKKISENNLESYSKRLSTRMNIKR